MLLYNFLGEKKGQTALCMEVGPLHNIFFRYKPTVILTFINSQLIQFKLCQLIKEIKHLKYKFFIYTRFKFKISFNLKKILNYLD